MSNFLTVSDFLALSPLLVVLVGALLLLLIESFFELFSKRCAFWLALGSLILALGATYYAPYSQSPLLNAFLRFDPLAKVLAGFFLIIGIGSTLLSKAFFKGLAVTRGEYYFLLLSAIFGLILIGDSADFLTLFLGLETLSISLYILCGYLKNQKLGQESSLKYFLMGALAAAFLLYGIALIYGGAGTTRFNELMSAYKNSAESFNRLLFLSGIAFVTLGLCFKAAIVPFHVWAPDVYEGAPTPVTAFMSVGTKTGAFAALALIFLVALPNFNPYWNQLISYLAYPTLIYANFVALRQVELKRFFAYSGISHAGFMLIPLAADSPEALPALLFYLAVYGIATLGAFAALAYVDTKKEIILIKDLNGLFHKAPFMAALFTLCLFTLAGIPPTAGFFAKFYLFKLAFQSGYFALLIVALLMAILAAFYYLRIVSTMLAVTQAEKEVSRPLWSARMVAVLVFSGILFLSFYPKPLLAFFANL